MLEEFGVLELIIGLGGALLSSFSEFRASRACERCFQVVKSFGV